MVAKKFFWMNVEQDVDKESGEALDADGIGAFRGGAVSLLFYILLFFGISFFL